MLYTCSCLDSPIIQVDTDTLDIYLRLINYKNKSEYWFLCLKGYDVELSWDFINGKVSINDFFNKHNDYVYLTKDISNIDYNINANTMQSVLQLDLNIPEIKKDISDYLSLDNKNFFFHLQKDLSQYTMLKRCFENIKEENELFYEPNDTSLKKYDRVLSDDDVDNLMISIVKDVLPNDEIKPLLNDPENLKGE